MSPFLDRRAFLGRLAVTGVAAGVMPPVDLAAKFAADEPFAFGPQDDDAKVFAAARKRFLFPTSVTYCNTGTLGAIPRDVMDVVVKGTAAARAGSPRLAVLPADGEPLTGYNRSPNSARRPARSSTRPPMRSRSRRTRRWG
jgi:hypothetical protein